MNQLKGIQNWKMPQ